LDQSKGENRRNIGWGEKNQQPKGPQSEQGNLWKKKKSEASGEKI